jgi:hypothetical protein
MPKIHLPEVSLVMVETQRHLLARLAVEDCLKYVDFGEVIICSDQFHELKIPGARYEHVENFGNKIEFCEYSWYGIPDLVRTGCALLIQWDSWIINPAMWRGEFLSFDYIGPPWWYNDGLNVGNSGFNLRSKRLMDFLVRHRDTYPMRHPEDEVLCRRYRPSLEETGDFKWASDSIASDFAFERTGFSGAHFGFHGTFNWPRVLEYDRLIERVKIAECSEYVRATGMFEELCRAAPWLSRQLGRPLAANKPPPMNSAGQVATDENYRDTIKNYVEIIKAHLLKHDVSLTQNAGEKPCIQLSIIVDAEGHLRDCKISAVGRMSQLDEHQTILKVQRASPFPKPPKDQGFRLELTVLGG